MPVSIATFPFLHFASGHTYFTQSLQDRGAPGVHDGSNRREGVGFTPIAVHTTFQVWARGRGRVGFGFGFGFGSGSGSGFGFGFGFGFGLECRG